MLKWTLRNASVCIYSLWLCTQICCCVSYGLEYFSIPIYACVRHKAIQILTVFCSSAFWYSTWALSLLRVHFCFLIEYERINYKFRISQFKILYYTIRENSCYGLKRRLVYFLFIFGALRFGAQRQWMLFSRCTIDTISVTLFSSCIVGKHRVPPAHHTHSNSCYNNCTYQATFNLHAAMIQAHMH